MIEWVVKLRHCEKATKLDCLLSKRQNKWEIFLNFVAVSENVNFN